MNKILADQRARFGDFEVVDFVDEGEVKRLRDQINVEVPVHVHWSWDYVDEIAELRRLYEKGKVSQWNAATDLDWSVPVVNDEWVVTPQASMLAQMLRMMGRDEATQKAAAFDELSYTLSQLLHGEQAALQICGQLTNVCDDMDQKLYAASQVVDEARHIEAIARFLSQKMGTIHPIGGTLKVLLDLLLQAEGMEKKVLGMQTLFEGMAVGIMGLIRGESRNPLLSHLLQRVEQDEARHAAFGVLNMRRIVKRAEPEQLFELEDWAFSILEALNANQQLDMLRVLGPEYGIDPLNVTRMVLAMPNFADLNSELYMHTVVPNLVQLGLITERTEGEWRRLGMMTDSRAATQSPLPLA